MTGYCLDTAVWRFLLYPLYFCLKSSKHQKIGYCWKDLFRGSHLSVILSPWLKYFKRWACLMLIVVTGYWLDTALWRLFLYPQYLHHRTFKHQKIGCCWKDIFTGYYLSAILSPLLKYLRRYACLKLIYLTGYWSDVAVWRFFLYPLYLYLRLSKYEKIGYCWKDIFKGYHLSAILSP